MKRTRIKRKRDPLCANCGVFKLNVDGTRSSNGLIGAGGVIRDHNGEWYQGFMRNIGTGEVLQAEAWGLYSGLQIAIDLGIKDIVVETDSAVLVSIMNGSGLDLHPLGTLLLNCRHIMGRFDSGSLSHVHRERNMMADCLAKKSIDQEIGICRLPSVPDFAISTLLDDMTGFARPRSMGAASSSS